MKLEFHDAPPPANRGGRTASREMVKFMEALKAHPGKWAKFPDRVAFYMRKSLADRGFDTVMRNTDKKIGDMWACWPKQAPALVVKERPAANGKNVVCEDCGWATAPEHVADLDKHTRLEHRRVTRKSERMPKAAA